MTVSMTEDLATPEKPADAPAKVEEPKPSKAYPPVLLKGEIKIFPDRRLPKYDQGAIKAYAAASSEGAPAFAMLCEKYIVPQSEIVHKYAGIITPHLPKLIACGVVDWNVDSKERFAFVYEDKLGKPVAEGKNPAALALRPELVISTIFRNLMDVMHAMRDKGITHGNIRVQNLFDGGTNTYENTMLGETLTSPSGYSQPVAYETITRALSLPLGKGPAEFSDDIYALGVTVAALLRTQDPAEGLSDDEIIAQKMEIGSFNFITGKSRFPALILEFLRGTLNDDPELRWTFDDILVWADGRRVNAKQASAASTLKASRPLEFGRRKFLKPQILGVALPKDPALVVPLVENGELNLWLNRSIQNKELEERCEQALGEAKKDAGTSNFADRVACTMAIALAPESPIFYKNLKFTPSGFGNLLIEAMSFKKELAPFVDLIQSSIIPFWGKCTPTQTAGTGDAINRIGNCQRFMSQSMIGYGIERCIYYLCPMAPCLSEKLDGFYVRTAEDYVMALEKLSTSSKRPEWFLDRHIVAFLSVRDKSIIEPYLSDIGSTEKYRQRRGVLKCLAAIQRRDKIAALPGLSQWIGGMLDTLIDRYHDRDKRRRIKDQLEKIKTQGSLDRIAALFDNYDETQMDMKQYTETMRQYQMLRKEYLVLENELNTNPKFGIGAGRQAAMLASGFVALVVVALYIVFNMIKGGGKIF